MEKIVKCRKDYKCDCCEQPIKSGEYSLVLTSRAPKYNNDRDFKQIGIEYIKTRLHSNPDICNKVNGFEITEKFEF